MRKMIYKDVDPMNYDEFKTELSNSNNIYLVAELENEIVGICFYNIKEILRISVLIKSIKKRELVKNYIIKLYNQPKKKILKIQN